MHRHGINLNPGATPQAFTRAPHGAIGQGNRPWLAGTYSATSRPRAVRYRDGPILLMGERESDDTLRAARAHLPEALLGQIILAARARGTGSEAMRPR